MNLVVVAVDDDRKITILLKKELEAHGHTVFTADDGLKGLELIKENNPDLLICDMLIPGIHGAELAKQLREDPASKDLKIIMMTGVYKKISWLLERNSWADGFIEKPFEVSMLADLIHRVMNRNKGE